MRRYPYPGDRRIERGRDRYRPPPGRHYPPGGGYGGSTLKLLGNSRSNWDRSPSPPGGYRGSSSRRGVPQREHVPFHQRSREIRDESQTQTTPNFASSPQDKELQTQAQNQHNNEE